MEHDYRDVLLKAATIVEERWCQNTLVSEDGRVCAAGAIATAAEELTGDPVLVPLDLFAPGWRLYLDTRHQLGKYLGTPNVEDPATEDGIVRWNDAPGRTSDEVAEALRKAAS